MVGMEALLADDVGDETADLDSEAYVRLRYKPHSGQETPPRGRNQWSIARSDALASRSASCALAQ
jgi:hypothetical protein